MLALAVLLGFSLVAWSIIAGIRRVEVKLHAIGFMLEWIGSRMLGEQWMTGEEMTEALKDEESRR